MWGKGEVWVCLLGFTKCYSTIHRLYIGVHGFVRLPFATLRTLSKISGLILGGSWLVRSRVLSRVTIVITHIRGLIALLLTTHEPPSMSGCKRLTQYQGFTD